MDKSLAPALTRGLMIFELILREGSLSYNQLEKAAGFNASSLNRILRVLVEEGYVHKTDDSGYSLGLKVFMLVQNKSFWGTLISKVNPILHEISNSFQVTVPFYIYEESEIIVADKVMHPDNVAMRPVGEGKNDYLLSPWGFLYIAQLSPDEQKRFIDRNLKCDKAEINHLPAKDLDRFIALARERGYSDDEGLVLNGIRRLAAPVFGLNGKIIAAIGVGSFIAQLEESIVAKLIDMLKEKASALSLLMSHK